MINYTNYPEAELTETNETKPPSNGKAFYFPSFDGCNIRIAIWENNNSIGTVLLQQGYNEFIEKYFEVIKELLDKGYSVISFDWRGQGLSDRLLNDHNKAYIESFETHDQDLKHILEVIIEPNFSKPLIGIGHSMGGCLMLSAIHDLQDKFDLGILCCPMLGFKNEFFLKLIIPMVNLFYNKASFFPGSRPNMGKETPFDENDVTSDIFRYQKTQKLVRKNPKLKLWGVTNAWVAAVNKRLKIIRSFGWAENVKTEILLAVSLNDKVVDASKSLDLARKIPNCNIIEFHSAEHEIFMEKDIYRKKLWEEINNFLI